jgi:membrane protein DedA with SNARE-associated domain
MLAENAIATCVGLLLLSFVHEETAIIAGGYLVTGHQLPVALVVGALTVGIIAGDWAIYGLGAFASRLPRLERWINSGKLVRPRAWLQKRLLFVIVVARLFPGPGILFPVFSGLGVLGVSFPRFAVRSAVVAAIYTPVMLYLTVLYGDALVPRLGWVAWLVLLIAPAIGLAGPWARPLRRWASGLVGIGAAPRSRSDHD